MADTRDIPSQVADKLTGREIGRIWWIADNKAEADEWLTRYMGAGALHVKLAPCATDPFNTRYDVIITLYKDMTGEILCTGIDGCDWLEE